MNHQLPSQAFKLLGATLLAVICASSHAQQACRSNSTANVTPLIELYTSEGCDSCPPADRWLSGLNASEPATVVSWHVDYWDRLGWRDRFGLPEAATRQARQVRAGAARSAYTPQTMVHGLSHFHNQGSVIDRRVAGLAQTAAPIQLQLNHSTISDGKLQFDLNSTTDAGKTYQLYVAVVENKLSSVVTAGENKGVTLKHDHVVRAWAGPFASNSTSTVSKSALSQKLLIPKDAVLANLRVVAWADDANGLPAQSLTSQCKL